MFMASAAEVIFRSCCRGPFFLALIGESRVASCKRQDDIAIREFHCCLGPRAQTRTFGKIDSHDRTLAKLALNGRESSGLLREAVDCCEPKSCAFARTFGGEERFPHSADEVSAYSDTMILHA